MNMKKTFYERILFFITTCGGIGYVPILPGTAMTFVAMLFLYFIPLSPLWIFVCCAILTPLGIALSNEMELKLGLHDPSCVVIDELVGMWIGLLFVPRTIVWYGIAFLLFRFFDGTKCLGGNEVERLSGGWGIMLDDVYAGCQTLLIVHALIYLANHWLCFAGF